MPTDQIRTEFNAWVARQLAKANTLADKIYWKGMFV